MKIIALTQRVEYILEYNEIRDSLDEQWLNYILECGFIPLILPNNVEAIKLLIKEINIDGFILTGGNHLEKYGGKAPNRDELERFLIDYSIINDIPLIGVCRGMQVIQDYFGVELEGVQNHVANKHKVFFVGGIEEKNSYHNMASRTSNDNLSVVAKSYDGIIEAVKHNKYRIYGIMWHPERNTPFDSSDISLFKNFFN